MAWDNIDDPAEQPSGSRRSPSRGHQLAQEIRDMAKDGYGDEAIARELGCHLRTVERALRGEAA